MKPSSPEFLFVGSFFFITASILLGVICLFRFSDSFWYSFGRLYVPRNLISASCPVCWHIIVHNIFLQSFVFLWCQLFFLLFHFSFYFFGPSLFFSWWLWLNVCQSCLSVQRTSCWIHWSFVLFFTLFHLLLLWLLLYLTFYSFWALFVVFQVPISVKLECLIELLLFLFCFCFCFSFR